MVRRILVILVILTVSLTALAVRSAAARNLDVSTAAVTPTAGPAGSAVTGSGANWAPGDHIQAYWADDSSTLGGEVIVASDGTFTDPALVIPADATPGSHQILFTDLDARYFEVATFNVGDPLTVTGVPTVGYFLPNGAQGPTSNLPGWHDTSDFVPGEPIEYTVGVDNAGATATAATLTFVVSGPSATTVLSGGGTVQLPPGSSGWYLPKQDVPNAAPAGNYTVTVTVSQNGVSESSDSTAFTVTGQPRALGTGLIAGTPYKYGHTENPPTGQCTYGADDLFDAFTRPLNPPAGSYLPNFGNADSWGAAASASGWQVSTTPQYDSIVVFPANYIPDEPDGHVAWVTNIYTKTVNGESSLWITVDEMNGTAGAGYFDYYSYPVGQGDMFILVTDTSRTNW